MVIRRALWPAAVTLAAMVLTGLLLQPVMLLRIVTQDSDILVCQRIASNHSVTLVFTHSMYGGEVRETWRAQGSELIRDSIVTDNAAAAEYYATDGTVEQVSDGFEVTASPIAIDALAIRIDQIGKHRLRVGEEEVSLADRVDGSVGATISVRQTALVQSLVDQGSDCRS